MSGEEDLFREIILEHYKSPHCTDNLDIVSCQCSGINERCGDQLVVSVNDSNDHLKLSISPAGCAISTATASIMASEINGKSRVEVEEIMHKMTQVFNGAMELSYENDGDLAISGHVSKNTSRINCVMLPWRVLEGALSGEKEVRLS
jgi:nitrogen fixation NifU-like protein